MPTGGVSLRRICYQRNAMRNATPSSQAQLREDEKSLFKTLGILRTQFVHIFRLCQQCFPLVIPPVFPPAYTLSLPSSPTPPCRLQWDGSHGLHCLWSRNTPTLKGKWTESWKEQNNWTIKVSLTPWLNLVLTYDVTHPKFFNCFQHKSVR